MKKLRRMVMALMMVACLVMNQGVVFATTLVYDCKEENECNCSYVYGEILKQSKSRTRFDPNNDAYSTTNFLDDIKDGIAESLNKGETEYDFELVKYEIILLMDNYLDNSAVAGKTISKDVKIGGTWTNQVVTWTKKNAIEAFQNAYEKALDADPTNKANARTNTRNVYMNVIHPYIKFAQPEQTLDQIKDILKTLGMGGLDGKNLDQMIECLGHTHVPVGLRNAGVDYGVEEDCNCNHMCSVKQVEKIQKAVKVGKDVPGFDYYVEAGITTSSSYAGVMADTIKVGVIKKADGKYYVGECVCRLGAELLDIEVTPTWNASGNVIQPEGLTNVNFSVKPDKKIKEISLNLNLSKLLEDELDSNLVMEYKLTNSKIELYQMVGSTPTLVDSTKYTVTTSTDSIDITFNNINDCINANEEYRVKCYIPTKLGTGIKYDRKVSDTTTQTYLSEKKDQQLEVKVTLKGRGKIKDKVIGGVTVEVYETNASTASEDVNVKYVEIAGVY